MDGAVGIDLIAADACLARCDRGIDDAGGVSEPIRAQNVFDNAAGGGETAQHAVDGEAVGDRGGDEIVAANELVDHLLIVQIDAELADQRAAHLNDAHADENLLAALHLNEIDYTRRVAA